MTRNRLTEAEIDHLDVFAATNEIFTNHLDYFIFSAAPATGIIYQINNFISGHCRMRGKDEGRYPFHYLEMIENLFGEEKNTIEVCSRSVTKEEACFTVDMDSRLFPDMVTDGQTLAGIESDRFNRWRCDPPYNEKTAREMYHCSLPNTAKLLQSGARVCKKGALLFLLLGPQNYQYCPPGLTRIGWIAITIVPNNELRALHIYLKVDTDLGAAAAETATSQGFQSQLNLDL